MARPKERVCSLSPYHSPAFVEKCSREKENLHGHVANRLKDDILRLLTEEIHSDLTVVSGPHHFKAHSAIFYARAGNYFSLPAENCILTISGIQNVDNFIKQLYIMENVDLLLEEYKENLLRNNKDLKNNHRDISNSSDVIQQPVKTELEAILKVQDLTQDTRLFQEHDETSDLSADHIEQVARDTRSSYWCDQTSEMLTDSSTDATSPVLCDKTSEISANGIKVDSSDIPGVSVKEDALCCVNVSANNNVISCEDCPDVLQESLQSANDLFVKCPSDDVEHILINSCHCEHENSEENHSGPSNITVVNHVKCDKHSTYTTSKSDCLSDHSSKMYNHSLGGCELSKTQGDCKHAPSEDCAQSETYEACCNLGQNLLSLYLEDWGSDLDIMVSGCKFKTHKCILATRSQYFSAMFGGSWTESDKHCIKLEGISPTVFEQALLYLYGGVTDISKSCSLSELLLVADMYGIEGLKEVISFHLRKEYCHFFHKPCSLCTTTLADALMLSVSFGLDDVKSRCLRSVGKFFAKFWSTKEFAGLTEEVLELTCNYIASQLTEKTVIETILECHKLSDSLPRVKWAEPVLHWTAKLLELAIEYTSEHFVDVVSSEQFLSWRKSAAWSRGFLDEIFRTVIDSLPTEKACGSYRALLRLQEFNTSQGSDIYGEDVTSLLESLIGHCETYIKVYIHQVTQTAEWPLLPEHIKTKLLQNSSFVCIDPQVKGRVTMTGGHKSRESAAVIRALKEDNSFRQRRALLDKSRRAEKTSSKISNQHKQSSSGLKQTASNQNSFGHLASEKHKTSGRLQTKNIRSLCDSEKISEDSKMRTPDRNRLGSPKAGPEIFSSDSQIEKSADDSVRVSRADGTLSTRSGLRPARSTGSLSVRLFSAVVPGNRSLSTQNLNVDSWGLTRRPISCHTLETLVPLLETTFCKPCDLGEF